MILLSSVVRIEQDIPFFILYNIRHTEQPLYHREKIGIDQNRRKNINVYCQNESFVQSLFQRKILKGSELWELFWQQSHQHPIAKWMLLILSNFANGDIFKVAAQCQSTEVIRVSDTLYYTYILGFYIKRGREHIREGRRSLLVCLARDSRLPCTVSPLFFVAFSHDNGSEAPTPAKISHCMLNLKVAFSSIPFFGDD